MQNPSARWNQALNEARFREDKGEDMMAVAALMFVFVVVVIHAAVRGVVIGMPGIVVVMIVGMYALCSHVLPHVPMQPGNRRPGKLERNDNHDDQGDEAAHAGHCTAPDVFTNGALPNLAFRHADLLVPNDSHYFADAGKVIWKRVFWSSDVTVIEPPCASTMDLTMASPSPAPSPLR